MASAPSLFLTHISCGDLRMKSHHRLLQKKGSESERACVVLHLMRTRRAGSEVGVIQAGLRTPPPAHIVRRSPRPKCPCRVAASANLRGLDVVI